MVGFILFPVIFTTTTAITAAALAVTYFFFLLSANIFIATFSCILQNVFDFAFVLLY